MQPAIQICQPGYDVRNCPDWAYLFNSNWPSLAVAFEDTVTSAGNLPVPHHLNYVPLTVVWDNSTTSYGRVPDPEVTATEVIISEAGNFTVRCYNVDISKDAVYPLPQAAQARLPYNDQFGLKQVKEGKQITSNNLNDFVIHTRAQSPAVLEIATQNGKYYKATGGPGGVPAIVYPFRTSYIPWVYGYFEVGAGFYQQITPNSFTYNAANNEIIMNTNSALFNGGSLVVLRDPLFYPNVVSVVY